MPFSTKTDMKSITNIKNNSILQILHHFEEFLDYYLLPLFKNIKIKKFFSEKICVLMIFKKYKEFFRIN